MHSIQESFNETIFNLHQRPPTTRKFRIVCDPLHILKQAQYRMTKLIPMVVRQLEEFVELNLRELEELPTPSLPNVVLSDLQIMKMDDSLPTEYFHLLTLRPS
jgi:hypothetical protein